MSKPLLVEMQEIPLTVGHALEVRLEGEFLYSAGIDLAKDVLEKLNQDTKGIIVDLSRLGYIDSAGLGSLASLSMKAAKKGMKLGIFGLSRRIEETLRGSHLQGIFLITDTRDDALGCVCSAL